MPIKNTEEADLWPLYASWHLLILRFENIENNGDTVLIVLSYDSLVGVGSV
jgi:hypothetical protein